MGALHVDATSHMVGDAASACQSTAVSLVVLSGAAEDARTVCTALCCFSMVCWWVGHLRAPLLLARCTCPQDRCTCWMMPCVANQPAMHLARTSSLSVVCVEASALQGRPTPTSPCSSKRSACCCTHSPPDDSDPTVLPSLHLASAAVAVMSHRSCSSCRTPPPAACHPTKSRHCWWTPPQSCSTWPQAGRPPALHLVAWPLRWLEDRGQRQQQQHRAQPA